MNVYWSRKSSSSHYYNYVFKRKKKVMKFSWKGYYEPTPKLLRKIGDTLLGIFSISSMAAIVNEDKQLALISLSIGVVGKILTNFFTDD